MGGDGCEEPGRKAIETLPFDPVGGENVTFYGRVASMVVTRARRAFRWAGPRCEGPNVPAMRSLSSEQQESAVSKRTFQPNNRRRHKKHGFRLRMRTRAGQAILAARRRKGRARVAV